MSMWNESAEQCLLGAILLDPKRIDDAEGLCTSDFYGSHHRDIWKTMVRMVSKGESIDAITVAEQGHDLAYLGSMAHATTGNVRGNAAIIRKKAIERALMAAANTIITLAESNEPLGDKVEKAHAAILSVGEKAVGKMPRSTSEILSDVLDDMNDRMTGVKRVETIGYPELDAMVQLMTPGALNIVAARPSMGKTAFAMSISDRYTKMGKSVLFFSQEMADVSLTQRLLAGTAKIPLQKILTAQLYDDDLDRIQGAIAQLKERKLFIDEQTSLSISDIRTKCRQISRKNGLDLVVIDYLQLMAGDSDSRHEEIAEISRGLKRLAMDLKVPVIALSQLNRSLESRLDKRPQMADLRESGQIEQDADTILMLYRDEVYNQDSPMQGIAEVICRKNRQGRTGSVYMTFLGDLCTFESFHGELPKAEVRPIEKGRKWS
jgi:replicative DNA helicase